MYSDLGWTLWDMPDPAWVMENWPGRATMLALRCKGIQEGKPVDETRKQVSSLRTGAEDLLQPIHLLQCHRGPRSPVSPGPPLRSAVDRSGLDKSTSRTELHQFHTRRGLSFLDAVGRPDGHLSPWSIRSTSRLRTAQGPGDRLQALEHRQIP